MEQIVRRYRERTPGSHKLSSAARDLFPSGVTHDSRYLEPYGLYVSNAKGAHKWDVDGNRYVDYFGGHGSLMLGHAHPQVTEAVTAALARGTHFGTNTAAEIDWARQIQHLVPSAQRVRFTSSGTEATMLALRLARAFTGRDKILRFRGYFHGWHDHMAFGYANHFDGSPSLGVPQGVADNVVVGDAGDTDATVALFEEVGNQLAAVILEPTGPNFGIWPLDPDYVKNLVEIAGGHGTLVIFDEVITGFRVAPGGYQSVLGVSPDLTCFAKAMAGGLPGAAVCGRKDILDMLDFTASSESGREKVSHQGTFNANPISAAAGTAALKIIADTRACETATGLAQQLREEVNALLEERGLSWALYGTFSGFHLFTNPKQRMFKPTRFSASDVPLSELQQQDKSLLQEIRLAMLVNGVDLNVRAGGLLSASHTSADIAETVRAFDESLRMLA